MSAEKLLEESFGFKEFLPGQKPVIEALLAGRSALAVFPTGAGKSLCYQLPALSFDGVTVVVSPLIALMKDQIDFLVGRGIAAARLDSSLAWEETKSVQDRLRDGSLKLLYVAPERFNNERFLTMLEQVPISLFAIDEAHCISEWGHNFRPDYLKLAETARSLGAQRVLALTATATPAVVRDICAGFAIEQADAIVTGFYRGNLRLCVTPVPADRRDALLVERLRSRKPGPTIVYVTLQKTAERIAGLLSDSGFPAEAYHAGMDSELRTRVQDQWMASDTGIVVATIAFGMGIDKANVRYVYHYNLPKSLESYSQEIGRAGRDGLTSIVEMLACPDDVPTLENFSYGDTPTEPAIHSLLEEILNAGPEFDVALYDLSARHDIRILVLKTILTYLELLGVLRQGTPFYAGYEMKLKVPLPQIVAEFTGEPAELVESIFSFARKGRLWYSLNPDEAAESLGKERRRIVRALEYLSEHEWIELRVADARQRYYRQDTAADIETLSAELQQRFRTREEQEMKRLRMVLALAERDGCQTNALVGYFGQKREEPCGHCTWCVTSRRQKLPPRSPLPPIDSLVDATAVAALRAQHPAALGQARQAARFLCGLSSPAQTGAKLGARHPLFGVLEVWPFAEVLNWCEASAGQ